MCAQAFFSGLPQRVGHQGDSETPANSIANSIVPYLSSRVQAFFSGLPQRVGHQGSEAAANSFIFHRARAGLLLGAAAAGGLPRRLVGRLLHRLRGRAPIRVVLSESSCPSRYPSHCPSRSLGGASAGFVVCAVTLSESFIRVIYPSQLSEILSGWLSRSLLLGCRSAVFFILLGSRPYPSHYPSYYPS